MGAPSTRRGDDTMTTTLADARTPSTILFDPLPGTGYRAVRRIGGGSSSEVWEARAPGGGRCAVKVLRAAFADTPDAVRRIALEGQALASLEHPCLVRVLDAGVTAAGRPFFVMPLLRGETLRDRLRHDGPIDPREACAIFADVLAGLDAAHQQGIVHRDVKPANVFLPTSERGPRAVVLDFGVAKIEGATATTASQVIGTPRYLAPEQILGGRVDARTDVYAAGLSLYEAIAGRGPFEAGGAIELMRAHLDRAPRGLREAAAVPRAIDHAVMRAIEKPPLRRWPSARAFAEALERAAEGGR
jgi:serine/threonine protein kinase